MTLDEIIDAVIGLLHGGSCGCDTCMYLVDAVGELRAAKALSAKGATVMTADECKPGDRVMYGPYPATIVRVWNFDSVEIMQDRDHGRSSSTHPDALRRMSAKSGSEW